MAVFVEHIPCPRCGSRDNLATYDDGSGWCFGCHYYVRSSKRPMPHVENITKEIYLPFDVENIFPPHVVEWLDKYDIKIEEAFKWGWLYSKSYDQLIFPFYGENKDLLFYQARNFREGRKYYNVGKTEDVLPIFHADRGQTLVVVEDAVSAAKIARQSDSMPCLGSHLPTKKLTRLKPFYEFLMVWLDADKFNEAKEIADKAKWLGFITKVVYTDKDPKEYTDEQIKKALDNIS